MKGVEGGANLREGLIIATVLGLTAAAAAHVSTAPDAYPTEGATLQVLLDHSGVQGELVVIVVPDGDPVVAGAFCASLAGEGRVTASTGAVDPEYPCDRDGIRHYAPGTYRVHATLYADGLSEFSMPTYCSTVRVDLASDHVVVALPALEAC
jgi:hypothetical protein